MHGRDTYLNISFKYILQDEIDVCKLFSFSDFSDSDFVQ